MSWPRDAYVGQKVVCLEENASLYCICGCGVRSPEAKTVYTISKVWLGKYDQIGIDLIEYPAPNDSPHNPFWNALAFRPVQGAEKGMGVLRGILKDAKREVKEDA